MSKWCITTSSPEETEQIGRQIGSLLSGGEIIELVSDLGGGKTTLTKGIARGAGYEGIVSSPTFTISSVYKATDVEIHHYDFYRIGQLGVLGDELQEVIDSSDTVSVIEWAGEAHSMLPTERLIRIDLLLVADNENARKLVVEVDEGMEYVLGGLEATPC